MHARSWVPMVRFLRRGSRLTPLGLTVLASLALAAPVAAQTTSERREAAEDALARAEQLTDGRGVRTGRELTTALAELATQRSALRSSDRDDADELLARPPDTGQTGQPGGPYNPDATMKRNCSAHFCVHWVEQTEDAPSLAERRRVPDARLHRPVAPLVRAEPTTSRTTSSAGRPPCPTAPSVATRRRTSTSRSSMRTRPAAASSATPRSIPARAATRGTPSWCSTTTTQPTSFPTTSATRRSPRR